MRATKYFSFFGRDYRTTQFAAVPGLALMKADPDKGKPEDTRTDPLAMLRHTEVMTGTGWTPLDTTRAVNEHIFDAAGILSALMVLRAVIIEVREYSFGFLKEWRGVKVPSRLASDGATVSSGNVEPLVLQLVGDGVATLKELSEDYSLFDAFVQMDIIVTRNVNAALAQEAAERNRRK